VSVMKELLINNIIPCTINITAGFYVLKTILNVKIDFKDFKVYIAIALLIITNVLNCLFVPNEIRIIFSTILMGIGNYFVFRKKAKETVLSTICLQLIFLISEIIFAGCLILLTNADGQIMISSYLGQLVTNIIISLIAIALCNIKLIKLGYNKLIKITNWIKIRHIIVLVTILMIAINILLAFVYYEKSIFYILTLNLIFFIIYGFITYEIFAEKNNSLKIQAENKALVDNLGEYEKMLDYQRVANHENKNQLLLIKNMINKNEENIVAYIDEVVHEKREDNENLYYRAKKIPTGGLQGIVYQKMLVMQEKGIKINLDVSRDIKQLDFNKLTAKLNYDLCRIMGVLLDNAIEETLKVEEKEIAILIYKEAGYLGVSISNHFKEMPNLELIDQKGYTTKSSGHGFGLSLVKQIVDGNSEIVNERSITKDIFCQIVKIKM
ncbi:MAG: GHKL domain-containing protein, partial [Bacilli bacterium]